MTKKEKQRQRLANRMKSRVEMMVDVVCVATGVEISLNNNVSAIIKECRKSVGLTVPSRGYVTHGQKMANINVVMARCACGNFEEKPGAQADLVSYEKAKKFYASTEWRRVRYGVLTRDNATCQCCGATRGDGVALNVDHIVPLRVDWSKRLDVNNLQTLCSPCNHGKLNTTHDWRKHD